jgi:hypothetical protein
MIKNNISLYQSVSPVSKCITCINCITLKN